MTIENNNILIENFITKCENIEIKINDIWENIILCNFKVGMDDIIKLFADLEILINYANSLNEIKSNILKINSIFEKLTLLENAMSIPDYTLVADMIRYEIKPTIELWRLEVSKFNNVK